MDSKVLLTPFFLDEPMPALEGLMEAGWLMNKPDLPGASKLDRISHWQKPMAAFVTETIGKNELPVTITGDCTSAIAVTAGIQRAGIEHQLIWFDAHGDFNTHKTSPGGFLGGMPLAMLVGRGDQTLLIALGMDPHPEARVILTDARDLDPLEGEALRNAKVRHIHDVADLTTVAIPDMPLHIHFDSDILDPAFAPAMNYFSEGGPDLTQLKSVFRHLAGTGRIVAVSLSSWNPALDTDGSTQQVCMEALDALIRG